jgi:hypothetical protein
MFIRKYLKIFVVLLVFILGISCSDQSYEEYQQAVEKTENLESGKYSIEMEYQTNFNEEELSVEEFKALSNFSNLKFSGANVFNHQNKSIEFYGNLEGGNLALDLEYFQAGEKKYLKIPILGKYLDLNDSNIEKLSQEMTFDVNENININIDEEVFEKIGSLWTDAIQEENVFKGEKSLLETPDGDIKVTEYSIELSDKLLKELVKETMIILEISNEVELMNQMTIQNFDYKAFVDIDGFVIKEDFAMDYLIEDIAEVDSGHFKFEIINYDLNKVQDINIPEIKDTMLLDLNRIDDLLEGFEGLNIGDLDG